MIAWVEFAAALPPQETEVVTTQTLWSFLASGGPVMFPLAALSVVATAFAFERYLRLRRSHVLPKAVGEALELVEAGKLEPARARAEASRSPGGRILLAGLRRRGFPLDQVEAAMEDQGQKELERLRAPIRPIQLIGNLAPLLGLLGTVIGISEAFHRVVKTGMGKPEHLASGIEQALTTTICGLIVAIPALLVAAHLQGKVRRLMLVADERLAPAVEQIAARGAGGAESDAA